MMALGREIVDWNRFSELIVKLHNVNCVEAGHMIKPYHVHPHLTRGDYESMLPEPSGPDPEALKQVENYIKGMS